MGIIRNTKQSEDALRDQFYGVDDLKLRSTLTAMANKASEEVRDIIYATYNNDELNTMYRNIRSSNLFNSGSKDKSHRLLVKYPNGYVWDFVNTVMTELHGPRWTQDKRNLNHDLIRPWMVVEKI